MFNLYIILTIFVSVLTLHSVSSGQFPFYYTIIIIGLFLYYVFYKLGFIFVSAFYKYYYVVGIVLLFSTLLLGQLTRGTLRWIPIGSFSFQPAEFFRPFLILFMSVYMTERGELKFNRLFKSILLLFLPLLLIFLQPSLSVTILAMVGYIGVLFASDFNKKYILFGILIVLAVAPAFWFLLAPYQKLRVTTFLNPQNDPLGAGYNSIQSVISVGSGELTGKGLGRGVQTQLLFLPEKQTDFIFAAVGEELGFVGLSIILILTFLILFSMVGYMENSINVSARAYLSGFTLMYLFQVLVHVGMNIGIMPVSGLPYPLLSSGGSSFLSMMIGLGIAKGCVKR